MIFSIQFNNHFKKKHKIMPEMSDKMRTMEKVEQTIFKSLALNNNLHVADTI